MWISSARTCKLGLIEPGNGSWGRHLFTVAAVDEGVNELMTCRCGRIPLLVRRGGRAIKKWSRSEKARTGWSLASYISECVLKRLVWATPLSAALRSLRDFVLMPQP